MYDGERSFILNLLKIFSRTNKNGAINFKLNGEYWSIPISEDNRHYQAILKWIDEGNTIEEAD